MPNEESSTNGSSREAPAVRESDVTATQLAAATKALQEILTELRSMRPAPGAAPSGREPPVAAAAPVAAEPVPQKPAPDYRERLVEIGRDHVSGQAALNNDANVADVMAATVALAKAAAITEACAQVEELWPTAREAISVAEGHYHKVKFVADELGVVDALTADDYYVLRHLDADFMPAEDLEILRMAGQLEADRYLRAMVRRAHQAPELIRRIQTLRAGKNVTKGENPLIGVLAEGEAILQGYATGEKAPKAVPEMPKKRKIWTAIGKILKGAAVTGGNLVPVFTTAGLFAVNPAIGAVAAAGAVGGWEKILTSCGAGVGDICEGVGAFRGE